MPDSLNVICLESSAFYELIKEVVDRLRQEHGITHDKWILADEAMKLLGIRSKSSLFKIRSEGKIRYTQPEKKIILYDRESILDYLEKHAHETF